MESILHELFTEHYNVSLPPSRKQIDAERRVSPYQDKIKETLGLEFLDQFNAINTEREGQYDYSCFRAGFLLGARMMLEALEV